MTSTIREIRMISSTQHEFEECVSNLNRLERNSLSHRMNPRVAAQKPCV
jgi:hypothetical protein